MASGQPYLVTVFASPAGPTQTSQVFNGSGMVGAGNVTNVAVDCTTSTYSIGGTVSGLTGPGLVLQDNASDNLSVPTNGNFVFPTHIASGATYDVTILSQPYAHCAVTSGGTGVVGTRITSQTNYVMPFLKGVLLYLRSPH